MFNFPVYHLYKTKMCSWDRQIKGYHCPSLTHCVQITEYEHSDHTVLDTQLCTRSPTVHLRVCACVCVCVCVYWSNNNGDSWIWVWITVCTNNILTWKKVWMHVADDIDSLLGTIRQYFLPQNLLPCTLQSVELYLWIKLSLHTFPRTSVIILNLNHTKHTSEKESVSKSDWNRNCTPCPTDQCYFQANDRGPDPRNGIWNDPIGLSVYSSIYSKAEDY